MKDKINQAVADVDWARQQLAAWLSEWELDTLLAVPPTGEPEADSFVGEVNRRRSIIRYPVQIPEPGVVLLFHPPLGREQESRPLYGFVLEGQEGMVLIVPFGCYRIPAVPQEWRTPFRSAYLDVLCFWNERLVRGDHLPGFWVVHRATARQLASCQQARRVILFQEALPRSTRQRYGPPLLHPGDPRHEYIDEERERVSQHLHKDGVNLPRLEEEGSIYLQQDVSSLTTFPLAAEPISSYGVRGGTYVSEDHEVIVATYVEDPSRIRIRVVDREGRVAAAYENGCLEAATGERSDRIRQGVALGVPGMARQLTYLMGANGEKKRLITTLS